MQLTNSGARTLETSKFKLAYFPVPKTASTSMKYAFYKLEHGQAYVKAVVPDRKSNIHNHYFDTRPFTRIDHKRYEGFSRIAIIRDPARRIVSAYVHRVKVLGELAPDRIDMGLAEALGVQANPTRNQFMNNIEKYRVLSAPIWHHTNPFTYFLGSDMRYFTDVVKMSGLEKLAANIRALTGQSFDISHHNQGDGAGGNLTMGPKARKSLLTYCAGDYALLKDHFPIPPALLKS